MDLIKLFAGWQKLEFWNQIGIMAGVIGVVLSILALAGVHMQLLDLSLLLLSCGFLLLIYGNVQQSKKLSEANDELNKVDNKIDRATASVYAQKKEEIDKLELEIAAWKDEAASWQNKAALTEEAAQKERINAEQTLQSERSRLNSEIDSLVKLSTKPKDQLEKDNKERQRERIEDRLLFYSHPDVQEKAVKYDVDAYLDPTTPEETLFNEAEDLKKV